MPLNSTKKKRRDRAKGTDDGEEIRDEIADKNRWTKDQESQFEIAIHKAKKSAGGFIRRWIGE